MIHAAILSLLIAPFLQKTPGQAVSVQGPSPGIVRLGDSAKATIEIEGTTDCEIVEIPKVADLEIQVGAPSMENIRFSDGKKWQVRSSTSFPLFLRPGKEGVFEIPFIKVRAGAETYKTRAVRVEAVKDITGSKYAFLEVTAAKKSYFVNEPVRVKIRFGIDTSISRNLLQMFNRHLDPPVQIQAPWIDEFPGGVAVETAKIPPEQAHEIAANLNITQIRTIGNMDREGRAFTVYELERAWIPGRTGEVQLSNAMLRFHFATKIVQNGWGESVAQDRQQAFVYGETLKIDVKPIPEEGRPTTFAGAVGKFKISAEATPHDLKVGESLKFKFRIEGEGNLEFLEPPSLGALDGFHVYGNIDDKNRDARTITYDLSPLNENVKEIPPVVFTYFETEGVGAFKTVKTEPIPIRVRPQPPGEGLAPLSEDANKRVVPGVDDIYDMEPANGESYTSKQPPGGIAAAFALGAPLLAAGALFVALRRREYDINNPAVVRARGARAKFVKSTAGGADAAAAFTTYLADRCDCAEAAIASHDLPEKLVKAGVPPELARDAAAALLQSLQSRYAAGSGSSTANVSFAAFVDSIEKALAAKEGEL